jgi:hypothetical protein
MRDYKKIMNQCDGCRTGSDTKQSQWGTLHVDRLGRAFMACVAELYTEAAFEQFERQREDAVTIQREMVRGLDDAE